MGRNIAVVMAVVGVLSGCAAVSEYDKSDDVIPILFKRLKCELYTAKMGTHGGKTILSTGQWEVFGFLDAVVEVKSGVAATGTYKNDFSTGAGGSAAWTLAPTLSVGKKKTFEQFYTIAFNDLNAKDCDRAEPNAVFLRGDLGVVDAAELAMASLGSGPNIEFKGGGDQNAIFSHEVEFTVSRGIGDSGPTWVIEHFSGIGALFHASRDDVSTLKVVFKRTDKAASATKSMPTISSQNLLILNTLGTIRRR
jgi:hypothetical protein